MPNGYDKNWVRLCAAINGFRVRYNSWPTRVRMWKIIVEDLRDNLFTPESFAKLQVKLELVVDERAGHIAEDGRGRYYDYGNEGFSKSNPDIDASFWLGIEPDREEPQ